MLPEAPPSGTRLGVVLVNWNRWADTIECLESLLRSDIPLHVAVVDNGSTDGSLERIAAWAAGSQPATAVDLAMEQFSQPPLGKPLAMRTISAAEIPPIGAKRDEDGPTLTLIDAAANRGFAAGNNLGLRWLMPTGADHFWLLNNDTVVEPGAAAALLARMDATHAIGMCGTIVRYYHRPDTVQALGGSIFSFWSGQSAGIGFGQPADMFINHRAIAEQIDFVLGASLGVSRAFLETVGPMHEGYFLYFEEIDWAVRGGDRFVTAFAHGATVFHKEGGSIGSSGVAGGRSAASEYWLTRSRLRFIVRHRPILLPWHVLITLPLAAKRLLRLQPRKAWAITRALLGVKY